MKLVCLGVDGGSYELVSRWASEGRLPNFARLMAEGASGELRSVIPPVSAQAWSSFMTGKNPGKHGIYGFRRLKPGTYEIEFTSGRLVRAATLWRILSHAGRRVIVINVPMTYPPEEVNGLLVSGMDAPGRGSEYTHPPELKAELDRIAGKYVISQHFAGSLDSPERLLAARQEMLELFDVRCKVTLELAQRYPWDFLMVKFNLVDQSQHYFWKFMNGDGELRAAIYEAYSAVDAMLPVFEGLGDYLVILSDHGAGPHSGKNIFLNEWLRREGYLTPKGGGRKTIGRLLERGMRFLARRLSHGAKDELKRLFPRLVSGSFGLMKFSGIRWAASRAFLGECYDSIRINQRGVFPEGIVEPAEYDGLRDEIGAKLLALRDPETGAAIIRCVHKREDIYRGPFVCEAPDLIVEPEGFSYTLSKRILADEGPVVRSAPHWRGISGVHRLMGMLFLKGPGIVPGRRVEARIEDVAPTILYALGEGIPADFDGRVLTAAFEPGRLSQTPPRVTEAIPAGPRTDRTYTDTDSEAVGERLRNLGYIE